MTSHAPPIDSVAANMGDTRPSSFGAGGLQALCVLARLHHVAADPAQLQHRLGRTASESFSTEDILSAAALIGLRAKRVKCQAARLPVTPLPALALMQDGSVVLLAQCDG